MRIPWYVWSDYCNKGRGATEEGVGAGQGDGGGRGLNQEKKIMKVFQFLSFCWSIKIATKMLSVGSQRHRSQ